MTHEHNFRPVATETDEAQAAQAVQERRQAPQVQAATLKRAAAASLSLSLVCLLLLGLVLWLPLDGGGSSRNSKPAEPRMALEKPRNALDKVLQRKAASSKDVDQAKGTVKDSGLRGATPQLVLPGPAKHCVGECQSPADTSMMMQSMTEKLRAMVEGEAKDEYPHRAGALSNLGCVDGFSGPYPCKDISMLSFLPLHEMGESRVVSDMWGWTDSVTGREYALVGLYEGAGFVDVTNPENPEFLGLMRAATVPNLWHDLKVYKDHLYVVSEAKGHGLQVFDLTRLRAARNRLVQDLDSRSLLVGSISLWIRGTEVCMEAPSPSAELGDRSLAAVDGRREIGGVVHLQACEKHKLPQQWRYDSAHAQLQNGHGLCAELWLSTASEQEVQMKFCNASSARQRWMYDVSSGRIRGALGVCLDGSFGGGNLALAQCDSTGTVSSWRIGAKTLTLFEPDAVYTEFTSAHNIVINEQTGRAYVVGSHTCKGGLHIIDIKAPTFPAFLGCFADDGYVHDAQCVVYEGPDASHQGKEICFMYNEDTLTIADVTDAGAVKVLSRTGYENSVYTHQGWFDQRQEFLFLDDELDELNSDPSKPDGPTNHTRTMIWDARSLSQPTLADSFYSTETAIDHNLYTDGRLIFQSNYGAGLRILEILQGEDGDASSSPSGRATPSLSELAYFDVSPRSTIPRFTGSWSHYSWFASGNVVVTSMSRGIFVLRPEFSGREDLRESRRQAHNYRLSHGMSS